MNMSIQAQLKEAANAKRQEAVEIRKRVNELAQAAEQAEKEAEGTQAAYDAYIASTSGTTAPASSKGARNKVKATATVKKAVAKGKAKAAAAPKKAPKAKATKAKAAAAPKKKAEAPKVAAKAKAAAPKKKAVAKAKAAPTAKKSAANAKISKTRKAVADGKIPPLKERLRLVMGSKEMEVKDIITELEKKNWLPDSKDPSTYMSFMLSSSKDDFERVSRGKYKVLAKKTDTTAAAAPKAEKKKVTPRKTNGKAKAAPKAAQAAAPATPAPSNGEVDKELASLGTNVAENPFL